MNYQEFIQEMADLMPAQLEDVNFQSIMPRAIEYSENRCYADLDLLSTQITNDTGILSPGNRTFALPTNDGTFVVVEQVAVFATTGVRTQLLPVARGVLDYLYPSDAPAATPSVPSKFARISNSAILVGPPPDDAYPVEVVGTIRPAPLSIDNPTTPLTILVPQLFSVCTMVFLSGYMHDFAPASDDPQLPVTWEAQYQKLKTTALVEEFRKKFMSQGWKDRLPSPIATPPQT